MQRYDLVVVGSGISGLSLAIKYSILNPDRKVAVFSKSGIQGSNTYFAQGGIAVVQQGESDSFDLHIADTLSAGDDQGDEDIVGLVVREGPARLRELISWGTRFDKTSQGSLSLHREGGHSQPRIVHSKDATGREIMRTLHARAVRMPNIHPFDHHFCLDLITEHHTGGAEGKGDKSTCYGVYALDERTGETCTVVSAFTVIATGGVGTVYRDSTNPKGATGDGIAMAYRAGARISDMAFIQFHPTVLFESRGSSFLITEALRGYGAILRDQEGNAFMPPVDQMGDLASRDIVSRSMDRIMKETGAAHLYLDCTHLDQKELKRMFPQVVGKCLESRIDPARDLIPVIPAAHYLCGGVEVDKAGRTSIDNLFACGECARTGMHGANRLASNSLLEGLVFAHRLAVAISELEHGVSLPMAPPPWDNKGTAQPSEQWIIRYHTSELKNIMSDYVGIVRSDERLARASRRLSIIFEEVETLYKSSTLTPSLCELRNIVATAHLIVRESLSQKVNKGNFYKMDNEKS